MEVAKTRSIPKTLNDFHIENGLDDATLVPVLVSSIRDVKP